MVVVVNLVVLVVVGIKEKLSVDMFDNVDFFPSLIWLEVCSSVFTETAINRSSLVVKIDPSNICT